LCAAWLCCVFVCFDLPHPPPTPTERELALLAKEWNGLASVQALGPFRLYASNLAFDVDDADLIALFPSAISISAKYGQIETDRDR
jgi:hypothetical protein